MSVTISPLCFQNLTIPLTQCTLLLPGQAVGQITIDLSKQLRQWRVMRPTSWRFGPSGALSGPISEVKQALRPLDVHVSYYPTFKNNKNSLQLLFALVGTIQSLNLLATLDSVPLVSPPSISRISSTHANIESTSLIIFVS